MCHRKGYNEYVKKSNLIVAAIFFALGFIIAWQISGAPMPSSNQIDENTKVIMETPEAEEIVTSPLTIKGQVRGTWYFEASFPIEMVDEDGKVLATVPGQARGDWMQEGFVPFEAAMTFNPGNSERGELVLKKDNPSGEPQFDDEVRIPIRFK